MASLCCGNRGGYFPPPPRSKDACWASPRCLTSYLASMDSTSTQFLPHCLVDRLRLFTQLRYSPRKPDLSILLSHYLSWQQVHLRHEEIHPTISALRSPRRGERNLHPRIVWHFSSPSLSSMISSKNCHVCPTETIATYLINTFTTYTYLLGDQSEPILLTPVNNHRGFNLQCTWSMMYLRLFALSGSFFSRWTPLSRSHSIFSYHEVAPIAKW